MFQLLLMFLLLLPGCTLENPSSRLKELIEQHRQKFPEVLMISSRELQERMGSTSKEITLLDARTPLEQRVSVIHGSQLFDFDNGDVEQLTKELPRDKVTVVYCAVGHRSAIIAQRLRKAGFTQVYSLAGGIFDWVHSGKPVYQGKKQVERVHPFNRRWGRYLKQRYHAND
jgi:rhodanese-related sulfurtransferase